MKKLSIILCLLLAGCASVFSDPYEFETTHIRETRIIKWIVVDNADYHCKNLMQIKSFDMRVIACASFNEIYCTIYTESVLNHNTVGHEIRHCFQGAWHD